MFTTAYETTACEHYLLTKTVEEINRHRVVGGEQLQLVTDVKGSSTGVPVYLVTPGMATIPPFAHPLVVETGRDKCIYVDVRNFTRLDQTKKAVVHAETEYTIARRRGVLQSAWLDKIHFVNLLNLGAFPIKAYSRWISDIITVRLALTPDIAQRVAIIAAFYYTCLFLPDAQERHNNGERMAGGELNKLAALISRAIQADASLVLDIISQADIPCSVNDLVSLIKELGASQRFETLNTAFLYTIIGGTWWGSNAREVAAVAIEHPPTWLVLLYSGVNERGYKNTFIAKIAQQYQKTDDVKSFNRSLEAIFN